MNLYYEELILGHVLKVRTLLHQLILIEFYLIKYLSKLEYRRDYSHRHKHMIKVSLVMILLFLSTLDENARHIVDISMAFTYFLHVFNKIL